MKITLKDYTTDKTVLTVPLTYATICGRGVFVADVFNPTFNDEIEQAVYAVNNDDHFGIIADNWSDNYETPIDPYLSWVFED
jgi:hypothetical protein